MAAFCSSFPPPYMAASLLLLCMASFSLLQSASGSSSSTSCIPEPPSFLYNLQSQCPVLVQSNPPLQVDGNVIEEVLSGRKRIEYISMLFYASWCPFSQRMLSKFESLSSMFPQIEHLVLEQSSAWPSLYSKYGIHSLPAILLVNQTSRLRYHGPKYLLSLLEFYERNTSSFEEIPRNQGEEFGEHLEEEAGRPTGEQETVRCRGGGAVEKYCDDELLIQ